jgi:hypothetical protein
VSSSFVRSALLAGSFSEHDLVTCMVPIPRLSLAAGATGRIVHVHGQGLAFEVEFLRKDGATLGLETVSATDLKFEVAPLRTKADYKKALAKASQLVDLSPAPGSPDHARLETLLAQIGAYESTQVGLLENPTGAFQA